MDTRPEGQPACGFCDGSGLWTDPDADPAVIDPCPLCEGSGMVSARCAAAGDDTPPTETLTLARLLAVLPRLSQSERQRLYEELYLRYDCRIYRG